MEDKEKELLELAEAFIRNESMLEAYYRQCIDWMPEFKDQWILLSAQERGHAGVFKKIMQSIRKEPRRWSIGNYLAKTVNMMSDEVERQIEEIKKGKIINRYIVTFIIGVEVSMIESDLRNAFRTPMLEFVDLLAWVAEETIGHREILMGIEAKLKE